MPSGRVLVLGIDTPIGLTVVRELGERGVEVFGIARGRDSVGLYSRHLRRGYVAPGGEQVLRVLIDEVTRREGIEYLMTVSERDIAWCNAHRDAWPGLRLLMPDATRMARVVDKAQACEVARKVGITVPDTLEVAAAADIDRVVASATYPVILKWRDPNVIGPLLEPLGLSVVKSEYCYNEQELRRSLQKYASAARFPMVQSFHPGYGIGHMIFMHQGEALLRFQHRRVREWPPEGGMATVAVSVSAEENAELFAKSIALLRHLDWVGPAMVEYRYDPKTGRSAFMEINGRFWGSLPLAYHSGAHFAWYTYSVLGLGRVPPREPYRAGLRCRFLIPDTRRLLTVLLKPRDIQNRDLRFNPCREVWDYLVDFLRPHPRYFVFTWSDPLPAVADLAAVLVKGARRLVRSVGHIVTRCLLSGGRSRAAQGAPRPK